MENIKRLIRIREVQSMVPFCKAKIYKLIKEEKFPKQLKEGGSSVWLLEDVLNYIKNLGEQNSNKNLIKNDSKYHICFDEVQKIGNKGK